MGFLGTGRFVAGPNRAILFSTSPTGATAAVRFVALDEYGASVTAESWIAPEASFLVRLIDPIQTPWISCSVVEAVPTGTVLHRIELCFPRSLPDDVINALIDHMPEAKAPPARPKVQGRRMLVVEDHDETRSVLTRIMERRGFDVSTAGTVAEALRQLEPPPSCIILDLSLPDGCGETILERIRADRLLSDVAVCTGVENPSRLQRVRNFNPRVLLTKPIDVRRVLEAYEREV